MDDVTGRATRSSQADATTATNTGLGAAGDRDTPADTLGPGDMGGSSRGPDTGETGAGSNAARGVNVGNPGSRADLSAGHADDVGLGPADEPTGTSDVGGD